MTVQRKPCDECGGPSDFGVTNGFAILRYCIPCAEKLASELNLPNLASAAADARWRAEQEPTS